LLLEWVNWHLSNSNTSRRIKNFGPDLSVRHCNLFGPFANAVAKDSEALWHLLKRLMTLCGMELTPDQASVLSENDIEKRAEKILRMSEVLEARKFITPNDIVTGNEKLNILFVGNLFHLHTGLHMTEDERKVYSKLFIEPTFDFI